MARRTYDPGTNSYFNHDTGKWENAQGKPINASVGQAAAARSQGYTSIDNGWGTPVSGVNASGQRVAFDQQGRTPEQQQADQLASNLAQRGQPPGSTSAPPPPTVSKPKIYPSTAAAQLDKPTGAQTVLDRPATPGSGTTSTGQSSSAATTNQTSGGGNVTSSANLSSTAGTDAFGTDALKYAGLGGIVPPSTPANPTFSGLGGSNNNADPATISATKPTVFDSLPPPQPQVLAGTAAQSADAQRTALQRDRAASNGGSFASLPTTSGRPYGKVTQSDVPTHVVGPNDNVIVNGQRVPAGSSVTYGPSGPSIVPPSTPAAPAAPVAAAAPKPAAAPVDPRAAITSAVNTLTGGIATPSGGSPAAPAPLIAQTPTLKLPDLPAPTTRANNNQETFPAGTAAAQTPTAPAFNLATGATAAPQPGVGARFTGFSDSLPTGYQVPALTSNVEGADIAATTFKNPQTGDINAPQPSPDSAQTAAIARNNDLGTAPATPTGSFWNPQGAPATADDVIARNNSIGAPRVPKPNLVAPDANTPTAPAITNDPGGSQPSDSTSEDARLLNGADAPDNKTAGNSTASDDAMNKGGLLDQLASPDINSTPNAGMFNGLADSTSGAGNPTNALAAAGSPSAGSSALPGLPSPTDPSAPGAPGAPGAPAPQAEEDEEVQRKRNTPQSQGNAGMFTGLSQAA